MAAYGPEPKKFFPKNKNKVTSPCPITLRSNLEKQFAQYLDLHSQCVQWSCESIAILYNDPAMGNKQRRYIIDFTAIFRQKDGSLKKFIIEVKPSRQTVQPKPAKNKKKETYLRESEIYSTNKAKWDAADQYAKLHGCTFMIVTEKDIQK